MISLPRQARDKHRVALKTDRFLAASTSPRMGEGASMTACCRMSQGQDLASSITALRSRRKGRGQPRRLCVWNRSLLKRLCLAWRARCEQYFMPLLATPFSGSKTIICQDKLGTNVGRTHHKYICSFSLAPTTRHLHQLSGGVLARGRVFGASDTQRSGGGAETPFSAMLILKAEYLPRQARDRHCKS